MFISFTSPFLRFLFGLYLQTFLQPPPTRKTSWTCTSLMFFHQSIETNGAPQVAVYGCSNCKSKIANQPFFILIVVLLIVILVLSLTPSIKTLGPSTDLVLKREFSVLMEGVRGQHDFTFTTIRCYLWLNRLMKENETWTSPRTALNKTNDQMIK